MLVVLRRAYRLQGHLIDGPMAPRNSTYHPVQLLDPWLCQEQMMDWQAS